ncbi:hypothetical protein B0H34DRAFT_725892, partial [Crassisporium funariophilum]
MVTDTWRDRERDRDIARAPVRHGGREPAREGGDRANIVSVCTSVERSLGLSGTRGGDRACAKGGGKSKSTK